METVRLLNVVIVCVLVFCPGGVIPLDTVPIPAEKSQVESWFRASVQPLQSGRKGVDPALVKAEAAPVYLKVGKGGQFKTIQEAVKTIPARNTKRYIIFIAGGKYNERVKIDFDRPFVTLYGDPKNRPTLVAATTAAQVGTIYSATLYVLSDYFSAVNIDVRNSAPRPTGKRDQQAVALTITGDKASFYNCKFYGFQDTLCDHNNRHFYKDCYVEGTVDFVFGNAKSIFLNTQLRVIPGDQMAMVSAHGRNSEKEDTGFSFVHCQVTGNSKVAVLGRGWFPYSKTIFAYTYIGNAIKPEGWMGMRTNPKNGGTCYFGEYNNTGPGAKMDGRPKFVKRLTDADVKPFISLGYIGASKWLLPPITKAVQ
ncbi:PREDICTED: pectinesterase 2-like [Ipomoea nil]|uniref:pectinesterase 2-like n=1 Tax=Ipomoea nil TaxID=35883 RepID=UPI0009013FB2|nr:PREDICTED: pectinesterase 2-like [Ipomoea nil]